MPEISRSCREQTYDRLCAQLARACGYSRCVFYDTILIGNMTHSRFFTDVMIVCPTTHRHAISHHIHSDISSSSSFSSLHIDLQTYDESTDSSVGTCTLLRHFSNRILEDFILLSCDFIPPPSLPLNTILNKFRTDTVSDGAVATTCWFTSQQPEKGSFPDDWGPISPPVSIAWDAKKGVLLHIDTLDDFDRNSEELELRMSMLSRCVWIPYIFAILY